MTPADLLSTLDDASALLRAILARAKVGDPITSGSVHRALEIVITAQDAARALHPDPDAISADERARRSGLSGRVRP